MKNFLANTRDLVRAATDELLAHFPGGTLSVDDPRALCAVPGRPHPAITGRLCDHHLQVLSRTLRDIEDEALRLAVTPSLAISYDGGGGAPAFTRSPIRLEARVLRDQRRGTGITRDRDYDETAWDPTPSVLETLHSWERLVRTERHLPAPTGTVILGRAPRPPRAHGPICATVCGHDTCGPWITDTIQTPATVTGARDLLSRQLDWIARQPWVDDLYTDLTDLLAAMRRVNNTQDVHIGLCESLQPDGSLCDGKVWHVLVKPDGRIAHGNAIPGPDDEPGFRCATCRRVWTGTDAVRKRNDMWLDEQKRTAEKGKISS